MAVFVSLRNLKRIQEKCKKPQHNKLYFEVEIFFEITILGCISNTCYTTAGQTAKSEFIWTWIV